MRNEGFRFATPPFILGEADTVYSPSVCMCVSVRAKKTEKLLITWKYRVTLAYMPIDRAISRDTFVPPGFSCTTSDNG